MDDELIINPKDYEILLVDDDPLLLGSFQMILEHQQFDVTTADNGEKACAILENKRFDLVVTDLVMEKVDGISVLKKAKELYPEILVVILTGHGEIHSAIEALRNEADDYIVKNIGPEEILYRINNCLKKLELRRKVNTYESMLPVCCVCKKIWCDSGTGKMTGEWMAIEKYMLKKGHMPSHTYCPVCAEKAENDFNDFKG